MNTTTVIRSSYTARWHDVPQIVYALRSSLLIIAMMGVSSAPVWVCDVCGYKWLKVAGRKPPAHCPSRQCQSRKWNASAVTVPAATQSKPEPSVRVNRPAALGGSAPAETIKAVRSAAGFTAFTKRDAPKSKTPAAKGRGLIPPASRFTRGAAR